MKNILVIGQGGREHAIAKKLSKSPNVDMIYVMPGNSGMEASKIKTVNVNPEDFNQVIKFVKNNSIDTTIVGPENHLSNGIVDKFKDQNLKIFGPNKYCSQLESSKDFCKKKMEQFNIPTASYKTFENDIENMLEYIKTQNFPVVIKVDGLAAGKGVMIPNSFEEAKAYIDNISRFGDAANKIVIEEFLEGKEFSLLAFANNKTISFMQVAQDYKKAFDNDEGENTGGMGSFTPAISASEDELNQAKNIIEKMIFGLANEGNQYCGVLFAGLMATKSGVKVIEFNVRFGDPETEVILEAMENNLDEVIENIFQEKDIKLKWIPETVLGVVLAAKGYPDAYDKSIPILNFEKHKDNIYSMGIKKQDNQYVSNGGRILMSIAKGKTLEIAKDEAYKIISDLKVKNTFHRNDIGE